MTFWTPCQNFHFDGAVCDACSRRAFPVSALPGGLPNCLASPAALLQHQIARLAQLGLQQAWHLRPPESCLPVIHDQHRGYVDLNSGASQTPLP